MTISSPSNPAQPRVACGVQSGSIVTTVASGPVASSSRSASGISVIGQLYFRYVSTGDGLRGTDGLPRAGWCRRLARGVSAPGVASLSGAPSPGDSGGRDEGSPEALGGGAGGGAGGRGEKRGGHAGAGELPETSAWGVGGQGGRSNAWEPNAGAGSGGPLSAAQPARRR